MATLLNPADYDYSRVRNGNYVSAVKAGFVNQVVFQNSFVNQFVEIWDGTEADVATYTAHKPGFQIQGGWSRDDARFQRMYDMNKLLKLHKVWAQLSNKVDSPSDWKEPFPDIEGLKQLHLDVYNAQHRDNAGLEGIILRWKNPYDFDRRDIEASKRTEALNKIHTILQQARYEDGVDSYKIRVGFDEELLGDIYGEAVSWKYTKYTKFVKLVDGAETEIDVFSSFPNAWFTDTLDGAQYTDDIIKFLMVVIADKLVVTSTMDSWLRMFYNNKEVDFTWNEIESDVEYALFDKMVEEYTPLDEAPIVSYGDPLAIKLILPDGIPAEESFKTKYATYAGHGAEIDLRAMNKAEAYWCITNLLDFDEKRDSGSSFGQFLKLAGAFLTGGFWGFFLSISSDMAMRKFMREDVAVQDDSSGDDSKILLEDAEEYFEWWRPDVQTRKLLPRDV